MYPPLEIGDEVFGKDYCPGYVDKDGKWNTGFYCPPSSPESSVYCCGTTMHKYCCNGQPAFPTVRPMVIGMETGMEITSDYDSSSPLTPITEDVDIGRNSYVAAAICGLVAVTVLMTIVACFYCSCCLLYKKRRSHLPGGLYRIPASSTTCGLINSPNGPATPGSYSSSLVSRSTATPVFTSDLWMNSNRNPPQGQLLRTNPSLPQPPANLSAYVNPILAHRIPLPPRNSNNNNNYSRNPGPVPTTATSTSTSTPRVPAVPVPHSNNTNNATTARNNSNPNPSSTTLPTQLRLQRQLQSQPNPNLSRSPHSSNNNQHNYPRNSNNNNIPTIYNAGGSRSNPTGTMSSLISSVSFSSSSTSSLPPPYFIEQYRIRNRVRLPRNPPATVLLPSYNELQQRQQTLNNIGTGRTSNSSQVRRQPQHSTTNSNSNSHTERSPSGTSAMSPQLNDLSAPPRRNCKRNRDSYGTQNSRVQGEANRQILQVSNLQCSSSPPPQEYDPSGDKILNTSVQIQRSSSDIRRDPLPLFPNESGIRKSEGRRPIKSQSLENVTLGLDSMDMSLKSDSSFNAEVALRMNQAHAN